MIRWALIFLMIALVSLVLGGFAIAGVAVLIARALFLIFLVLFLVSLIAGSRRGSKTNASVNKTKS